MTVTISPPSTVIVEDTRGSVYILNENAVVHTIDYNKNDKLDVHYDEHVDVLSLNVDP